MMIEIDIGDNLSIKAVNKPEKIFDVVVDLEGNIQIEEMEVRY